MQDTRGRLLSSNGGAQTPVNGITVHRVLHVRQKYRQEHASFPSPTVFYMDVGLMKNSMLL
jgi:hypothetical protein